MDIPSRGNNTKKQAEEADHKDPVVKQDSMRMDSKKSKDVPKCGGCDAA